jgi:hypothetical protein
VPLALVFIRQNDNRIQLIVSCKWALRDEPVSNRGGKIFFLSGNLGRSLEIFCKICNVTITNITKQMHNYCIICTLVIIGLNRLVFVCLYIAIVICYIPQL